MTKSPPHRIFLVEDNPGDVFLLGESLRHHGISFELAHYITADAAIAALDRFNQGATDLPHVILLDYNVPRGDGCDILSAAARNPALASVPTVVLTSSMSPNHREHALRAGAGFYIIKPAQLDEFLAQVGGTIAGLLEPGRQP